MAGVPSFWLLVFISALGQISMNGVLPANIAIMEELSVTYGQAQLVLTVFLVAMLLFQLVSGSLSDRFGRRAVMLGGLFLFAAGGVFCVLANSIEWLLLGRFIQGSGAAACVSMPRTMVRDSLSQDKAASAIGYLTTAMMIAPLFGPAFGGWLTQTFGWRWMYGLVTVLGMLGLLVAVLRLTETRPAKVAGQEEYRFSDAFKALMADRRFLAPMLVMSGSAGVYYVYLAGSPFVAIELYGYTPAEYGVWFACTGVGYMAGNFSAGRWSEKVGAERMVMLGIIPLFVAVLLMWLMSPWPSAFALFFPALVFAFSNGICIPNLAAMGIGVRPEFAGTASGLLGVAQLGVGALFSSLLGMIISESALPLFALMTVCLLIVVVGLVIWRPVGRSL